MGFYLVTLEMCCIIRSAGWNLVVVGLQRIKIRLLLKKCGIELPERRDRTVTGV